MYKFIFMIIVLFLNGCSLAEINNNLQKTIEESNMPSEEKIDRLKSIQIYKTKLTRQLKRLFSNGQTAVIIDDIFKDDSLINYNYNGTSHEAFIETKILDKIITKYQNAIKLNNKKKDNQDRQLK